MTSGLGSGKCRRSLLPKFWKTNASLKRQRDPIGKRIIQIGQDFFSRSARGQETWETGDLSGIALLRTEVCHDRKLDRVFAIAGQSVHKQSISKKDIPFKALLREPRKDSPAKVNKGLWR